MKNYNFAYLGMVAISVCLLPSIAIAEESTVTPMLDKEEIYQLIKDKGYRCLECHDVEKNVVGPAWREVAAKRRNHKWAHELLAFRISTGSKGEYGTVEMPHNEVQEEDAHIIVNWILSLWKPNIQTIAEKK